MSLISRANLIGKWIRGFRPTAADYADFFDSFWHKEDALPTGILQVDDIASLPPVGSETTLYVVIDADGGETVELRIWNDDAYVNPATVYGGGGASSGTTQYKLAGINILFAGDAGSGLVTATLTATGELAFNIPAGVVNFSLSVPQSVVGVAGDGTLTSTFSFADPGPFNQSEETMRYPATNIFSRSTETSSGFDVELVGNNPQKRLLPFVTAGDCSHQVGGMSSAGSNWTITYRF